MYLHIQSFRGPPSAQTAHDSVIHTILLSEVPFNVQGSIKSEPVLLFKCHLIKAGHMDNLSWSDSILMYSSQMVKPSLHFSLLTKSAHIYSPKSYLLPTKKKKCRKKFRRSKTLWNIHTKVNLFFFPWLSSFQDFLSWSLNFVTSGLQWDSSI